MLRFSLFRPLSLTSQTESLKGNGEAVRWRATDARPPERPAKGFLPSFRFHVWDVELSYFPFSRLSFEKLGTGEGKDTYRRLHCR